MTNHATDTSTSTNGAAIVVRLPHDLRDALKARAIEEDRSVASLIRLATRAYVETSSTS